MTTDPAAFPSRSDGKRDAADTVIAAFDMRPPSGGRYLDSQKISFEEFKSIVVERLGCEPEQVTMDASFQEDLNADSLDLVELIYAFEENTGLEIPDEDAEKITTVGQAWEYIQEKAGS